MKLLSWRCFSQIKSFKPITLIEQLDGNVHVREITFIAKTRDGAIVAFEKEQENLVTINKSDNLRFLDGHDYDASQIDFAVQELKQKQREKELAKSRRRTKNREREHKRDRDHFRTL